MAIVLCCAEAQPEDTKVFINGEQVPYLKNSTNISNQITKKVSMLLHKH